MNTAKKRADVGQWRRQRAWEVYQARWWQKDIAAALGVSRASVYQGIKCAREGAGVEALRSRPHRGGPCKLPPEQRAQIPAFLARGAPA
jgi:transposase